MLVLLCKFMNRETDGFICAVYQRTLQALACAFAVHGGASLIAVLAQISRGMSYRNMLHNLPILKAIQCEQQAQSTVLMHSACLTELKLPSQVLLTGPVQ